MNVLLIINDAPYGTEKAYNALRLAMTLQKEHPGASVRIERILKAVIGKGGQVKACGTCCEARGIRREALLEGVEISTMMQLARCTAEADKALAF
jgi:uncharacterized protein involved in oxidation of intracellular sulfur